MAGSAYTYTFATVGEFFAWLIAWDLILEYGIAASTVAAGWSGYFGRMMAGLVSPCPRPGPMRLTISSTASSSAS